MGHIDPVSRRIATSENRESERARERESERAREMERGEESQHETETCKVASLSSSMRYATALIPIPTGDRSAAAAAHGGGVPERGGRQAGAVI
eukprot:433759-Rhodomonas_salina.3